VIEGEDDKMTYVIAGNYEQFKEWRRSIRWCSLGNIRNLTLREEVRGLSGVLIILVGTFWENKEVLEEASIREKMGRLHFVASFLEPSTIPRAFYQSLGSKKEDKGIFLFKSRD